MKNNFFFLLLISVSLFTSCTPIRQTYYQVYKTENTSKLIKKESLLIFEDDNCKISYDLWKKGGDIGFNFYNKTEKNIYLNLDECFFILNGVANNYFRNREFTYSTSSGATSSRSTKATKSVTGTNYLNLIQTNLVSATNSIGLMTSAGFATTFHEERVICIPPKSSKDIQEYVVTQALYRDCELFKYPKI